MEMLGSTADTARIFFYQPLISVLAMFVTYAYIFGKVRSAQEARDERLLAQAELRALQAERLAGRGASEEELKALEAEVKELRAKEERASEFIGFGEDTATSRRFSAGIRPPPTDVSRAFAARFKEKESKKTSPSMDESNAEIAILLLGTVALTAFLFLISG